MLSCLLRSLMPLRFSEPLIFLKSIIWCDRVTLFWCFEKQYFWIAFWNFSEILHSWGCGRQRCYFWSNQRVLSKNSTTQDSRTTFNSNLSRILQPARADWSIKVCYGTPCKCQNLSKTIFTRQLHFWTSKNYTYGNFWKIKAFSGSLFWFWSIFYSIVLSAKIDT